MCLKLTYLFLVEITQENLRYFFFPLIFLYTYKRIFSFKLIRIRELLATYSMLDLQIVDTLKINTLIESKIIISKSF